MNRNYKKITILLILLDVFLFLLLAFLFKAFLFFICAFVVKVLINLSVLYRKKLKPVLIFDGILALLPILAIVVPFLIQLFIQSGNLIVISWVVIIFGVYTIPVSLVYGALLLTFGILSLRSNYKKAVEEHEEE